MNEPTKIQPAPIDPGSAPTQPQAANPMKVSRGMIYLILTIVAVIGLANATSIFKGGKREAPKSPFAARPASSNAQQVSSFQAQQDRQAQHDQEDRVRAQQIAAQMKQYDQEQAVPGPESPNAAPMTPAQRNAIYGTNNPNAPQKTSAVSQAQAEAKQRALAREKLHQDAVNSDTVAIDFSHSETPASMTASTKAATNGAGKDETASVETATDSAQSSGRGEEVSTPASVRNVSTQQGRTKNAMAPYDFDQYGGKLYRVFEGTVFEGVVTNHIDGGFNGPMLVMLTTDYYSHDHQQLLLPQGTRLIGQVQSVGSGQQRKLFVVFNRAVCPDGFSIELNKYMGLDPLGTTGLATGVNNHYLSSFAAAAAIGGLGGLAQIGNSGSVLTSSTQIRNGISEQTAQESEQILNRFLSRLPVITVKEGSRARVYINQDILIPSYAEHRVDATL